jgi:hypothetical protein
LRPARSEIDTPHSFFGSRNDFLHDNRLGIPRCINGSPSTPWPLRRPPEATLESFRLILGDSETAQGHFPGFRRHVGAIPARFGVTLRHFRAIPDHYEVIQGISEPLELPRGHPSVIVDTFGAISRPSRSSLGHSAVTSSNFEML